MILSKLNSFLKERMLGIRTNGKKVHNLGGYHYSAAPYFILDEVLNRLNLKSDDVLVDIGSGKGRMICCAARRKLKEVIGIEIDPELHEIAVKNINNLRGKKTPVRSINIPAEEFDFDKVTVAYLFNPFDRETLKKVIAKIQKSLRENPRRFKIVYLNGLYEDAIQRGPFCRIDYWKRNTFKSWPSPASFWVSV